jgi:predicted PurR-regulated permease PerM
MAKQPIAGIQFEDGAFLGLVLAVTIAFGFVLEPFFGAILWSLVLAILFGPLHDKLLAKMPGRPNSAAALTLLIILLIVIIPTILLGIMIAQELISFYGLIQSGDVNLAALFAKAIAMLPGWVTQRLEAAGLADFPAVLHSVTQGLSGSIQQIAGRALLVGQGTFNFLLMLSLMLYLTFFLLRDGDVLVRRIVGAVPLDAIHVEAVIRNFTVVIRATVKGSLVVAIVQGALGGIIFSLLGIQGALLWGVVMGAFSLIPAVGTGIVWVPVALYLLASGAYVEGAILAFCGMFVIGMVDNILRPILVGRDTRMPDYLVLFSTLGGLQVFGISGFIIGPVIAALFIGTWNIFTETWRKDGDETAQAQGDPPARKPAKGA